MLQFVYKILNLKGHPNCIAVSRVTVILMNGGFLYGGASAMEGLQSTGLTLLVLCTIRSEEGKGK